MRLLQPLALAACLSVACTFAQSQTIRAGETSHEIAGIMILDKLPKAWTQPKYSKLAADKPAPANHVYIVIKGKVTNAAAEDRNLSTSFLWLEDGNGTKYKNDGSGTVIYQPEGTRVTLLKVPGGSTKPWVGFFPVPRGTTGMKLIATDLKYRNAAKAELALPDAMPGKPAAGGAAKAAVSAAPAAAVAAGSPLGAMTAQSIAGAWALDEAFSKQAADGNTAGLMKRVTVMADGTFVAMYGIKGKWKIAEGRLLVTYDGSAGARSDELAAVSGAYVKWPSPSDRRKFCYMRKL